MSDPLVQDVLQALGASVDPGELRRRLSAHFKAPAAAKVPAEMSDTAKKLQSRIGLADILDDTILNAARGDQAFPLRLLFSELVTACADNDVAFALASGLNLYFRAPMPEEAKVVVGVELSRLYYTFARASLERELIVQLSPLLAKLMSTELDKTELESVDHQRVFDSASHERGTAADGTRSAIVAPLSFLCRVSSTGRPRLKAMVLT